MKQLTFATLAFVAATTVAMGARTPADDPNVGTWNLNVARSKFDPGPAPKSQTHKIEAWDDDGVKFISDGVDASGNPMRWELQAKYDGKFYEFKGNPNADMAAYKRIDANTVHMTTRLGGKQNTSAMIVVSKDGNTRTVTQVGTNAKGQKINNVFIYDRQ